MRRLVAFVFLAGAFVCVLLAAYSFDQTVNPPRCGSEEVMFSCHGDLWYHLVSGVIEVVVGLMLAVVGLAVALRLRVVRG